MKNDVWEVVPKPEGKVCYLPNGSTRQNIQPMEVLRSTKLCLFPMDPLKMKESIMKRHFLK